MKTSTLLACSFAIAAASCSGLAQTKKTVPATISGPPTWASGQPTTVTWTGTPASTCASGVQVVVNVNNAHILSGSIVPFSAGRSAIQGITVPAGTPVNLTLKDMCTGNIIVPAYPVKMIGGTAAITPVAAPAATAITPQVRANIDAACQGVLGSACSFSASYSSIYTAITQQISQGKLGSDVSSVQYNYLIPMLRSSPSWEANVVDNAWRSTGCTGAAPEAQWEPQVVQLQTYAAVVSAMRQQGCSGAAANTTSTSAPTQYVTSQDLGKANVQVWGLLASFATTPATCSAANGAVTCARAALAAYVKKNGIRSLQMMVAPIYQQAVGQQMDDAHSQVLYYQFGNYWSGADDLATYLQSTAANWRALKVNTTLAGLNAQGCLVDPSGAKLAANESCGLYFLDSKGVHTPTAYAFTLDGKRINPTSSTPGGGLMMSNSGMPLMLVTTTTQWAIGNNIVAQGGGNIVAQGGGNIVAQGGGNIVAQGGGNIMLNGGGNIVAQGGGNLIQDGAAYLINPAVLNSALAARTAGLIDVRGASIISQDGNGLLASASSLPAIAAIIGENSSGVINTNGSNIIADNGGGLCAPLHISPTHNLQRFQSLLLPHGLTNDLDLSKVVNNLAVSGKDTAAA